MLHQSGQHQNDGMAYLRASLGICNGSSTSRLDIDRAIWKSEPENKVYLGNYITTLAGNLRAAEDDLGPLEECVRLGNRIDPDNARYNYILAGLMLRRACELEDHPEDEDKHELVVKNRALLDKAMREVLQGL